MNAPQNFVSMPVGDSSPDYPFDIFDDLVVIEQALEEKTSGGIVLTGVDMKLPCGRVVAHGPGRIYTNTLDASSHNQFAYFVPITVKVGDWVVFGRYQTGEPYEINGKRYITCRQGDLAGRSKTGEPVTLRLAKVE